MSEPIPLLPVGPILAIAILLLAAIAKAGEFAREDASLCKSTDAKSPEGGPA